jgi:predicted protein tyrosine phosphatase
MKILFICWGNLNRSPTAEEIFKDRHETRSAALEPLSPRAVRKELLEWADIVIVMEDYMREELKKRFPSVKKRIEVLGIPDIYARMDPGLCRVLEGKVKKALGG